MNLNNLNRISSIGLSIVLMFYFFFVITMFSAAENFVIEKKKKNEKVSSISNLKEQYAQKIAEVIKQIADVQKGAARVQRILIDDVEAVFEGGNKKDRIGRISKEDLEKRIKTVSEFGCQMKKLEKQVREVRNSLR